MSKRVWRPETSLMAILIIAAAISLFLFAGIDSVVMWLLLSVVATLLWGFWTIVYQLLDRVSGGLG